MLILVATNKIEIRAELLLQEVYIRIIALRGTIKLTKRILVDQVLPEP